MKVIERVVLIMLVVVTMATAVPRDEIDCAIYHHPQNIVKSMSDKSDGGQYRCQACM